jgi:hypothetical protein
MVPGRVAGAWYDRLRRCGISPGWRTGLSQVGPLSRGADVAGAQGAWISSFGFTLTAIAQTARGGPRSIADWSVGGGDTFAVPLLGVRFLGFAHGAHLRSRTGSEVTWSRRRHSAVATSRSQGCRSPYDDDNSGRPDEQQRDVQIVDERWDSPVLHLLLQAHHSDPLAGVVTLPAGEHSPWRARSQPVRRSRRVYSHRVRR